MENKFMEIKNNCVLKILVGISLICFSVASIFFAISSVKSVKLSDNDRNITISGESEVKTTPDSATIITTIRNQAAAVSEAQKIVDDKTNKLVIELEKIGIAKNDIRSTSYRTGPKYEDGQWGRQDKIIGHEAEQTLEIKVNKIELANSVVSVLGRLEISEVSGPNFKVGDNKEFKSKARIAAIENSKKEAQVVARALDAKLGKVIRFTEDEQFVIRHPVFAFSRAAEKSGAQEDKLLPGEEIIKAKVTIVYAIE